MTRRMESLMDKTTLDKYLASEGNRCPYCESEFLNNCSLEQRYGPVTRTVICDSCGKAWEETYKLANAEELVPEEEIDE